MAKREKRYHHGDLRRAILDAVLTQIEAGGPETVSLRAASRAVGVSPGAAFRHFPDKQAVMTVLATEGFTAMSTRISEEASGTTSAMARFGAVGRGYLLWALANPAHFRVMFRADLIDRDDAALGEAGALLRSSLSEGLRDVLPDGVGEEESQRRALVAWGAVHGVATLAIEGALADGPNAPAMPPPEDLGRALAAMEPVFSAPPEDRRSGPNA